MKDRLRKLAEDYTVSTEAGQALYNELCVLFNVSNCDHTNEVQRQGDGFVYTVCGDCGKDLD